MTGSRLKRAVDKHNLRRAYIWSHLLSYQSMGAKTYGRFPRRSPKQHEYRQYLPAPSWRALGSILNQMIFLCCFTINAVRELVIHSENFIVEMCSDCTIGCENVAVDFGLEGKLVFGHVSADVQIFFRQLSISQGQFSIRRLNE